MASTKEDNRIQDETDAKFNDRAAFEYDKQFQDMVGKEFGDLQMSKGPKYTPSSLGNSAPGLLKGRDKNGNLDASSLQSGMTPEDQRNASKSLKDAIARDNNDSDAPRKIIDYKAKYSIPIVAAGSLGMAGIIGFNSLAPGPAQFLQIGQLLEEFHMFDAENTSDSRMKQIWRYARDIDDPQNRRLGELGKASLKRVDARMASAGYTINHDGRGRLISMDIDSTKTGKSAEELKEKYAKETKMDPERIVIDGDTVRIQDLEANWEPFKKTKLFNSALVDSGYGKKVSWMLNRNLKARSAVSFNPSKRLTDAIDNKVKDVASDAKERISKKKEAWTEVRKEYVTEGAEVKSISSEAKSEEVTNPDGEVTEVTDPDNVAAAEEFNTATGDVETPSAAKSKITGGLKVAGGVAFAVNLGCLLRGIGVAAAETSYQNVMLPAMRVGMELLSIKGQIESGEDVDLEQLGFLSESLYQEEVEPTQDEIDVANNAKENFGSEVDPNLEAKGTSASSWVDANDIKYEMGEEQTGFNPPPELNFDENNLLKTLTDPIPLIDDACGVVSSLLGQVALFAVDVASGGSAAVVGMAVSAVLGPPIMDWVTNWIANEPINLAAAGASYGSYANFGVRAAASQSNIPRGGRPLSSADLAEWKVQGMEEVKYAQSQKSVTERLFSNTDARSFVSSFARIAPHDKVAALNTAIKSPFVFLSSMKYLVPGSTSYALAAEPFAYGFEKYGFSYSDVNDATYENPFENEKIIIDKAQSELGRSLQDLHDDWGVNCFNVDITNNEGLSLKILEGAKPSDLESKCGADDADELFKRYRFYVLDIMTLKAANCYDGDEKACTDIGLGNGGNKSTNTPSEIDGVECPENLEAHPSQEGYFKLPEAAAGEYAIVTPEAKRYGSKTLVCVLSTVGNAYGKKYEGRSKVQFNDLNAAGHASHNVGVAVDLGAGGEIGAADGTKPGYNTEATIELGKMFIDTGVIKNIWWCEPSGDGSTAAIKAYADEKGKPVNIQCLPGHNNHFHVDIADEFKVPGNFTP